jgi:invasion protein IalB
MSRVLIGVAAAIVVAAGVFAVVHFSSGHRSTAPRSGWAVVPNAPTLKERDLVGTFGPWRLLCRNEAPGKAGNGQRATTGNSPVAEPAAPRHRCAVVLLMRNLGARKDWLNLRFVRLPTGSGANEVLFYTHGHIGETFVAKPGRNDEVIGFTAGRSTAIMASRGCNQGMCLATMELPPNDVNLILSAPTLAIQFPETKAGKADSVSIPTEGLKAAFAAMQRQPS